MGIGFDAGEVHTVLDDGDDEGTDEGAEDFASAAGEGRAADNHGGDHVEFIHEAVCGGAAVEL